MERRFVESLENRRHLSGESPALTPYDNYNSPLLGQFVSAVPVVSVGGSPINLALRLTNPTRLRHMGTIDLTFVLDPFREGVSRPTADKFDAVLVQQKNVLLNIGPRGSQTFKFVGTFPQAITQGQYWVAVAIDPGGSIDDRKGFGATIGAATTNYTPGFTDTFVRSFNVRLRRVSDGVAGSVSVLLRNGGNSLATGDLTVRIYASETRGVGAGDRLVTQQTVSLNRLRINGTRSLSIPFDAPQNLPGTNYFIRIELDRQGLPNDLNAPTNRNVFSNSAVPLK